MSGRRADRIGALPSWLIVGGGVVVMVLLFAVATAGLPLARPDDAAGPPGFSPAWPFGPDGGRSPAEGDALLSGPAPASVAASIPVTTGPASPPGPARRTPPATGPAPTRSRSADPAPTRPEVVGRYRVVASYPDSFIGEVLVVNRGAVARQWTVELRFPDNVGKLRGSWVDSAPPAVPSRSGDWYVFTGVAPVAAGSPAPLRFHLDRSGRGETPTECRVDGTRCVLS